MLATEGLTPSQAFSYRKLTNALAEWYFSFAEFPLGGYNAALRRLLPSAAFLKPINLIPKYLNFKYS